LLSDGPSGSLDLTEEHYDFPILEGIYSKLAKYAQLRDLHQAYHPDTSSGGGGANSLICRLSTITGLLLDLPHPDGDLGSYHQDTTQPQQLGHDSAGVKPPEQPDTRNGVRQVEGIIAAVEGKEKKKKLSWLVNTMRKISKSPSHASNAATTGEDKLKTKFNKNLMTSKQPEKQQLVSATAQPTLNMAAVAGQDAWQPAEKMSENGTGGVTAKHKEKTTKNTKGTLLSGKSSRPDHRSSAAVDSRPVSPSQV